MCITVHIALQEETLLRVTHFRHFLIAGGGLNFAIFTNFVYNFLESREVECDGLCVATG